jgi:hypothetical protein
MYPSLFINDKLLDIRETSPGCFTVENAYAGTYDYFGKLPKPKPKPKPEDKPYDPFDL